MIMITTPTSITIVYSIIEFHRLIPIILLWMRIEAIVTRTLGWIFMVRLRSVCIFILGYPRQVECFTRTIIEVVLWIKMLP